MWGGRKSGRGARGGSAVARRGDAGVSAGVSGSLLRACGRTTRASRGGRRPPERGLQPLDLLGRERGCHPVRAQGRKRRRGLATAQ